MLHQDRLDIINVMTIDNVEKATYHPVIIDEVVDTTGNVALLALVTIKIQFPGAHNGLLIIPRRLDMIKS